MESSKKIVFTIIIGIIICLSVSCKRASSKINPKQTTDTIFLESLNHVDTLLLNVKRSKESVWFNRINYSKKYKEKRFIIGSSLSYDNCVMVNNVKDNLVVEILGKGASVRVYHLKLYDFVTTEYSSYSYGIEIKIYFSFLIKKDLSTVHEEKFVLSSEDNGKTFDKKLKLIQANDTIYFKYVK